MWREKWAREQDGRDAKDYQPDMPPLEGGDYLIGDLFTPGEAGITVAGAMGAGPLTHEAIRHWMQNTGVHRSPWECRVLIRLSYEYLSEQHRAEKLGCEPPWQAPDAKREPTALQMSLRALVDHQ